MLRIGFIAMLTALVCGPAVAADKVFKRDDLADAAIRLEAQIKNDSGRVAVPLATLRSNLDAAFVGRDFRSAFQILGQIVTVAPGDSAAWLRLARTILQVQPRDARERRTLLERAATAAYIAYQRTSNLGEEAQSLDILSQTYAARRVWRPALDTLRLSLALNENADARGRYERLREEHGFRLLDYTVDSDSVSPRACLQFSEKLPGRRTDLSPFVSVGGMDKPALSSDDRQLCIEGLKHGEGYAITIRAGLPSVVQEALQKSAELTVYVRDRQPFVHMTGKAYVLPRTGQRGIPVVSVNTRQIAIDILRVGDRNLIDTVLGSDFQRNLARYEANQLANRSGQKVWSGELAVEATLNTDVTTAFPIDQAVGDLQPGVYVMVAQPKGLAARESYEQLATQWFIVSDLGLTAFSGNDGVHVFVNALATTEPKGLVDVRLMARNNEVLATRKTDDAGYVHFEAGLARGAGGLSPAMIVAAEPQGDYAFLSLKAPAFDLSDRGVAGRPVPGSLDAYVFSERGVYRPGETMHVTALVRDGQAVAAPGVPLTLVIERPDGVEYRRAVTPDGGIGGRSLSVDLVRSASTGTWRVRAYADPKRPPIGETTFMVEDYVPDRLEFDLASEAKSLIRNTPATLTVDGRFLYGAPAANLSLEGEVAVGAASDRPGFAGYHFGLSDEEVIAERQPLEHLPETDAAGKATFTVNLDKVPNTTRPLQAQVIVRMAESGGRSVERKLSLPVTPAGSMIGVKPLFAARSLGDGANAMFDVLLVGPDGNALAQSDLQYELLKVESRYQWFRRDGRWDYEPIKSTRRIADGRFDLAADRPGRISVPVSWGRYRLEVSTSGRDALLTSFAFDAGWYAEANADTPDLLEVALDKPEYQPGEAMTVAVTARAAGRLTLNVISNRLVRTAHFSVQPGLQRVRLDVGSDWGKGAYLMATLRRPLDVQARHMPGRAIGIQWFAIARKAHTLALDLNLPSVMRPNGTLRIPLKVNGLTPGEEARVIVAAVDVGILNLTNYKPPAPDDYYFGQRRLTAEIRDLYGQLIDGMQGARGQIRTGGDFVAAELSGAPPTQAPLALYSGIVTVGSDGTADVRFEIPAFAGSARVMASAWSRDKLGHASGDVVIRDPVVLTTTLPRFLLTGDRAFVQVELDNVEGQPGEYNIAMRTEGAASVGNAVTQTVQLATKQRGRTSVPLTASVAGPTRVSIRVTGPGGFDLERSYPLNVNPATHVVVRRTVQPLAKGGSLTLSRDLFTDLVPGTGSVAVSVSVSTALDAAALLRELDRYPFGCSEQIASRALPLLYVNELASESQLALDVNVDQRIRESIDRLLARQDSNGSFGLWSIGGDDAWLDAYVTDFLTRARARNFAVPDTAFRLALDRLRNVVATAPDPNKDGGRNLAYALYVLARNGVAPIGDLRYLADTKLNDLATPIAKAQIAAALGMLGDRVRAERVYAAALASIAATPAASLVDRVDYGSSLRDSAALVTLAAEGNAPRATIFNAVQRIEAARESTRHTSTQENAWLVLAARAIAKEAAAVTLDVAGARQQGSFNRTLRASSLVTPLRIGNAGEGTVQAVVSVSGAPIVPEPAAEHGFKIERQTYSLNGDPVDPATVRQNQRLAVVLKITEPTPQFGRIIVADYLPAGFEIDNPRLVSSGDTGTLPWITDAGTPVHSEFRDDHFAAAFERTGKDRPVFTVAYVVRAVSPGRYMRPQAYVEDMYRPDRFGRTGTETVEVLSAQ
ncbi:MAG: alpha-2-macroglobulin family protein [Rhizobiales bacterium]|nr:alpha-2-macroglobulin family protein [Hyphomicrobiales bacterium]